MKRINFYLTILLISCISIFTAAYAQTQETTYVNETGQTVIVTTVPAPKEVVVIPKGYVNCFTIPAGWNYKNIWVAEHKVCQYTSTNNGTIQGVAWVDGYWACTKYKSTSSTQSDCVSWDWQAGHWVKTLDLY